MFIRIVNWYLTFVYVAAGASWQTKTVENSQISTTLTSLNMENIVYIIIEKP